MAYILFITPSPESEVVSLDFCQKILIFIAVHRKLWITQFRTYESHASISQLWDWSNSRRKGSATSDI